MRANPIRDTCVKPQLKFQKQSPGSILGGRVLVFEVRVSQPASLFFLPRWGLYLYGGGVCEELFI